MSEFAAGKEPTQVFVKVQHVDQPDAKPEIEENLVESSEDSYQKKFWCFVLFLPFNPSWEIFTQISNTWLILYAIFRAHFYYEFHFYRDVLIYYILEILFLINTVIAYTHRYMPNINKFGLYPPRNIYLLLTDTASLLPIYELTYLLFPKKSESIRERVRLKVTLRIVHFMFFIHEKKRITSSNYVCLIIFIHTIITMIVAMIAAVIWSQQSCWPNCTTLNWSEAVDHIAIDATDNFQWFILCYTHMSTIVMHNCTGFLAARTAVEAFYLIVFMLLGFALHIIITTGQLIKITLQSLFLEHEYMRLLYQLNLILEKWLNIGDDFRDKVTKFYQLLWHKHGGVVAQPKSLKLIPMGLLKEVSMDIFWEMFKHSHILANLDVCVKKEMSLKMKTEFYMKGDYIMRKGVNKHRIIYIVSGIVQVLSIQDDDSAILSFSGGTLLSEITIVFVVESSSNLRCATDVIIQSLSHHELHRIYQNYYNVSIEMREIILERIEFARDIEGTRRRQMNKKLYKPVQRLKKQWRCISSLNRLTKKKKMFNHRLYEQIDYSFHSECLDLLVLSENLELQTTMICMKRSCPYVMEPNSSFRLFLGYVQLVVIILQCILIPYYVVFGTTTALYETYCVFFDACYIMDLYVNSITAIKTTSLIITEPIEIILYKFKTVPFIIDILATIPYDYIILLFKVSKKYAVLFKLPRTLEFYKIFILIKKKQRDLKHNRLFWIIFKYILLYAIFIYYSTALMLVLWCFGKDCDETVVMKNFTTPTAKSEDAVSAVLYSLAQFLDIGSANRMPSTILEMCYYTIVIFMGMNIYSFFLCEITCTIIKLCESTNVFRAQLRISTNFMISYMLPADLRNRAIEFLSFNFFHHLVNDIKMLRESMPDELNLMLMTTSLVNGLKQIPLFEHLSDTVLTQLTTCSRFRTLPENTTLCHHGERPLFIHLIRKGYCRMVCGMPGDIDKQRVYILKVGDSFPIIEALYNVDSHNTIYTITAVEEICVDMHSAMDIISYHRGDLDYITRTKELHLEKYGHLIKGRSKNLLPHKEPAAPQPQKAKKKERIFTYEINDYDIVIGARKTTSQKIGRYLAFKRTVHPRHRLNIIWEFCRSVFAVLYFLHYMLVDTIMLDYRETNILLMSAFKIIGVMDIFNRFHIQYYNKDGILIRSPRKTSSNYIKSSFILDVIAVLPLYELHLYRIYADEFYSILLNTFLNVIFFSSILYRPFLGLCYVDWNGKGMSHDTAHIAKLLLIFTAVCLVLANNLMLGACKKTLFGYVCSNFVMYEPGNLKPVNLTSNDLFFVGIYSVTTKFSASFISISTTGNVFGIIENIIVVVFLWICKMLITAYITAEALGGSMQMIRYRNNMTNFLTFIKKEMVSEETIFDFTEHFEFHWKKCEGIFLSDLFKTINEKLRLDISTQLFEAPLSNTMFFRDMHRTDLRVFIKHMDIQYFKRDAAIIRCNDIQDKLYFVSKGEVEIHLAGTKINTLKPGGVFGSFSKHGYTRQTITAIASMHVDLLSIHSAKFYRLTKKYPRVLAQMNISIASGDEFCGTEDFNQAWLSLRHQIRVNSSKFEKTMNQIFHRINVFVKIDSVYFKNYLYILHVHVAPLSCITLLFIQFTQSSYVYVQIYVCMLDLIFYFHIFLHFHLYYIDAESGIVVTDPMKIQKRYLKSFLCWVDIIGSIPFELLIYACGVSTQYLYYAMGNRLIRFFHLSNYYEASKRTLGLNSYLQCTYIFYMIIFQMSVTSLIWFLATCREFPCPYVTVEGDTASVMYITDKLHQTVRSFLFTSNMISSTNVPSIHPSNYTEVLISICIQIASVIFVALVFGAITSLIIINAVSENKYISDMDQVNSYLTNRNLSVFLIRKVQTYFRALWMKRRGEFLPSLIMEAPFYLKQNVMVAMYSHHLQNHAIFKNTHVDFIRQLCCHFQLRLYLAEQIIVEKGEVDFCMYFVHRGEVLKLKENEKITLLPGSAFGERQGLYGTPHPCTVAAHTAVDILILNKADWTYILEWFPASSEIIYAALTTGEYQDSQTSSSGTFYNPSDISHFSFDSTNYFDQD